MNAPEIDVPDDLSELDHDPMQEMILNGELSPDTAKSNGKPPKKPKLSFQSLRAVREEVRTREPRKWIVEGLIAETQYGVLSKVDKGQKTWDSIDMAVSVVTGTPWLGIFPVLVTGPVVVFAGEGDDDEYIARFDAVCRSKDLDPDEVAEHVTICFRVPTLTNEQVMAEVQAHLDAFQPTLVILDPLYLAVGGASGSDLYAMGEVLSQLQYAVQAVKAALLVLTHHKKSESSDPFARITGVGPGAWGRFLMVGDITDRHEDSDHEGGSVVTTRMEFRGGRIADKDVQYRRRIWSDDPSDLSSPLYYVVEEVEGIAAGPGISFTGQRVLNALRTKPGEWMSRADVQDAMADDGTGKAPFVTRTIQDAAKKLHEDDLIERRGEQATGYEWRVAVDAEGDGRSASTGIPLPGSSAAAQDWDEPF